MSKSKKDSIKKKQVDKHVEHVWIPWLLFFANIGILQLCYLWEAGYRLYPKLQLLIIGLSVVLFILAVCFKKKPLFWLATGVYVLHTLSLFL